MNSFEVIGQIISVYRCLFEYKTSVGFVKRYVTRFFGRHSAIFASNFGDFF